MLTSEEKLMSDSIMSFSSSNLNSESKELRRSQNKEQKSFSKDHKSLEITIDIDYTHRYPNSNRKNSSLSAL